MKNHTPKIAVPLAAITALLVMIAWIAGMFDEKIPPQTLKPQASNLADSVPVQSSKQKLFEPVPATVKAKQATIISSRILSRIEKIHVRAGDQVQQGQLLIELDDKSLESRVSQAKAMVEATRARLTEAKQALQRSVNLNKSGALSQAALETSQANYDALKAELNNAEQALHEAQTALGFARIYAPIDGRVVDRFAEPGDTIGPGIRLLSIYNPTSLRIEANVREQLALALQLGQQLKVYIPATQQYLTATIEERVPAGNTGSRTFLIKSRLPFTDNLLPGMYARLEVPAGEETLLVIPKDRVAQVGQLDVVWVAAHGIEQRRFIRTGKQINQQLVEVVSGLSEGEALLPIPSIHAR